MFQTLLTLLLSTLSWLAPAAPPGAPAPLPAAAWSVAAPDPGGGSGGEISPQTDPNGYQTTECTDCEGEISPQIDPNG